MSFLHQKNRPFDVYILRTHLIDSPGVFLYYKGREREKGVPFALNSIACFDPSDAIIFEDKQTALTLCEKLNFDKRVLIEVGYSEFEMITL